MLSDGRKVVDSFLVSESHEAKVLLCKLHAGVGWVDDFVAIEAGYTFRGEYKGFWLSEALENDTRFAPFRHCVTVIEQPSNLFKKMGLAHCETDYFKVEFASRELSKNYILSNYDECDIVTSSDVDEMLDFSNVARANFIDVSLRRSAGAQRIAWFDMLKFWYDFDNVSSQRKWFPAASLATAKNSWLLRQVAPHTVDKYHAPPFAAFEYSFCFEPSAIMRKLSSFSHDGYVEDDVRNALAGNYWVKASARGQRPGDNPADFFKTIELDEGCATKYVLENLAKLRTNNVRSTS